MIKHIVWRPLGRVLFDHRLAFEEMPFPQAVSMFGMALTFTHSKRYFPLTKAYDWGRFAAKEEPVVRLGVLGGTAQSAGMFMTSTKKHPRASLLAVGSRTPERGEACAQKYGIPRACAPYQRLLDDPEIEAVVVFCPISTHAHWIPQILDAGKHAFLIPPIAANTPQLRRVLADHRARHPELLCVSAYAALAHPVNHHMRQLIREGAVGEVRRIGIRARWPPHAFHPDSIQFNYALAGGAWEDLGPHVVTLARFLLDDTPRQGGVAPFSVVSAAPVCCPSDHRVDETMRTTLRLGDVQVDLEVSFTLSMDTSMEVEGTRGTLHQTQWYRAELFNRLVHRRADGAVLSVWEHRGRDRAHGRASWEYLLDHVVDAVRADVPPPMGSGEEELRTMEIIDAVYQASGLGVRCPSES
ncbi:MAG: Gfo/Idh/MocA family oxidoreductase [Alphaproteobacteria bacterium]|nr:Gfo/Idh/MocA family oxidoreductase [Alphaproteobacteria bacterium]